MSTYKIRGTNPKTKRRKSTIIYDAVDEQYALKMAGKELSPPFEILEVLPPEPATVNQINYAVNLGIEVPMNATKREMSQVLTSAEMGIIKPSVSPGNNRTWGGWKQKTHSHQNQIMRQNRAKSSQYVPHKICVIYQTAEFVGSEGEIYTTSLNGCQCYDFNDTGKPCKHIYRLAHELGLFDLGNVPNVSAEAGSNKTEPEVVAPAIMGRGCSLVLAIVFGATTAILWFLVAQFISDGRIGLVVLFIFFSLPALLLAGTGVFGYKESRRAQKNGAVSIKPRTKEEAIIDTAVEEIERELGMKLDDFVEKSDEEIADELIEELESELGEKLDEQTKSELRGAVKK